MSNQERVIVRAPILSSPSMQTPMDIPMAIQQNNDSLRQTWQRPKLPTAQRRNIVLDRTWNDWYD
jgi:hypothetical protein